MLTNVVPPGATRERILRAASELFARQGFSHVSMRAVAERAGATKPTLYYHFRDKETLFEECLAEFNEDLAATMQLAVRRSGGMAERVRAVTEALLTGSPFHPVRVHEELAEHVSGRLRGRLRATFRTVVVAPVVELFEDLQRTGELRSGVRPDAAAATLIGVCIAFLGAGVLPAHEGWAPLPIEGLTLSAPAAAEMVSDVVLRGLAGQL